MIDAPELIQVSFDGHRDPEVVALSAAGFYGVSEYVRADLAMPRWQPIETAPKGVDVDGRPGVSWMSLAIPDNDGGHHVCDGMRIGNSFFACMTYYSGGPFNEKQYEQREAKVNPSHWMAKLPPPEA